MASKFQLDSPDTPLANRPAAASMAAPIVPSGEPSGSGANWLGKAGPGARQFGTKAGGGKFAPDRPQVAAAIGRNPALPFSTAAASGPAGKRMTPKKGPIA